MTIKGSIFGCRQGVNFQLPLTRGRFSLPQVTNGSVVQSFEACNLGVSNRGGEHDA
jgi:hypothetical protein